MNENQSASPSDIVPLYELLISSKKIRRFRKLCSPINPISGIWNQEQLYEIQDLPLHPEKTMAIQSVDRTK